MSRIVRSLQERRSQRDLQRQNDIRWAIRTAVSAGDRDELIEIAIRNGVRV